VKVLSWALNTAPCPYSICSDESILAFIPAVLVHVVDYLYEFSSRSVEYLDLSIRASNA